MTQLQTMAVRLIAALALIESAALTLADNVSPPVASSPSDCGEEARTEFRERRYCVAHPVWETTEHLRRTKVIRPMWKTEWREDSHVVRKPVFETAMREEQVTVYEPVTSYIPQTVDQGQWVEQQTLTPRKPAKRIKWIPGGWTVDPQSGRNYWKPPMLRPVLVERPAKVTAQRVWQPNPTVVQTPVTAMAPRVHVRKVPVQQVRYVEEVQVRRTPRRVCRMVEQEIVERVPVTICRTVYQERVERVPVQAPVGGCATPLSSPAAPDTLSPIPVPIPMPPTSRPELDPNQPVPSPVIPDASSDFETGQRTSGDALLSAPLDPATVPVQRPAR